MVPLSGNTSPFKSSSSYTQTVPVPRSPSSQPAETKTGRSPSASTFRKRHSSISAGALRRHAGLSAVNTQDRDPYAEEFIEEGQSPLFGVGGTRLKVMKLMRTDTIVATKYQLTVSLRNFFSINPLISLETAVMSVMTTIIAAIPTPT